MAFRVNYASKAKNKFNAKSTTYDGKWYGSKLEASQAEMLDWRLKAGEIIEWKKQVKIDLTVNGVHITNYYIDFVATRKDGIKEYIEVKGLEMPVWQMKWRLLQALKDELLEPGAELIVIKK